MKILITGVNGFIGSKLANSLARKHAVVGIVHSNLNNTRELDKKITIKRGDLNNISSLKHSIKGVDIIFHCAALLPYHNRTTKEYFDVNVEGTKNLVKLALEAKVKRFIHISTVGIYKIGDRQPVNEHSPLSLSDAYAESKYQAEVVIKKAIEQGLTAVIIRPTIAYGPGDLRPGFLNLLRMINKNFIITIAEGKNYFHTIYIDNLLDALHLAMKSKKAIGEDFIIGDALAPKMKDILEKMAIALHRNPIKVSLPYFLAIIIGKMFDSLKLFGIPQLLSSRRVEFLTVNRKFSIRKATMVLGYKPRVGLEDGINETLKWYKENKYL